MLMNTLTGTKTISILGCGWLGLPLGQFLVEAGLRVKGSTTSPEVLPDLEAAGIEPYLLTFKPGLQPGEARDFFEADLLFLNIPPERRPDITTYHPQQIQAVVAEVEASPIEFVLFASSTSVYPDLNRVVTEADAADPTKPSGIALLEVERLLMEARSSDATVIRFAGLYGYDRRPGRFLAGRKEVANGDAPVNLIHRDDCIAIVHELIRQDVRGEIFNACSDEHPTRRALYTQAARQLGLEPPVFSDEQLLAFKVVSSEKLKQRLGYRFRYPSPLDHAP